MINIDRYKRLLEERLKPSRYRHTLGVYKTALELAEIYDADREKVAIAALLHDYAKNLSDSELLEEAQKNDLDIDEVFEFDPSLLHSPVGAALIRKELAITDSDILEAVAYHTTGKVGMGIVAKIVFLSDAIEPGRTYHGVEEIRSLAKKDLDSAMICSLNNTIKFVIDENKAMHPDSVKTRNWLLMNRKREVLN